MSVTPLVPRIKYDQVPTKLVKRVMTSETPGSGIEPGSGIAPPFRHKILKSLWIGR